MLGFVAVPTSEVYAGVRPVLSNWLPFLFYAIFAAAIPATMIAASFILPRPTRLADEAAHAAVRVRRVRGRAEPRAPLHRQLLPDGDPLHPLRHRDRLSLPARRAARGARLVRDRRAPRRSSRSSASPTSTSGGKGRSTGSEEGAAARERPPAREGRPAVRARALARSRPGRVRARGRGDRGRTPPDDDREGRRLGAVELGVAGHVRAGVLRDRDDVDRLVALRHRALRDGAVLARRRARPTSSSSRAASRTRWPRRCVRCTTRCWSRSG